MKRFFLLLVLALALLAAGCGKKTDAVVEMGAAGPGADGAGSRGERPAGDMPAGDMPTGDMPSGDMPTGNMGEGEAQETDAAPAQEAENAAKTLIGRVDSIVGNEATLALGEYASGAFAQSGETGTYLLPVGMSMGDGDFSSVSAGMVLRLSLDESGAILSAAILSK